MGIEKLIAKPVEVEIIEGETIKIPPLHVEELSSFMKKGKSEEEGFKFMEAKVDEILKFNYPESTAEQRKQVGLSCFFPIVEGLLESSGLTEEKIKRLQNKFGGINK